MMEEEKRRAEINRYAPTLPIGYELPEADRERRAKIEWDNEKLRNNARGLF